MPDTELDKAIEKLTTHGGYEWLLNGQAFWTVEQVVENLESVGMPFSRRVVLRWLTDLPHTQHFGKAGIRASKNDLIVFFVQRMSAK